MRVRFGDFVLDTDRRELLRGSEALHLAPKAFQLLESLVEHRPKAVSQTELQDLLWPNTFVDKSSLHNLIYQIRDVLDDKDQEIIRTAYGFGFSFGAPAVDDRPRAARWQIVIGDTEFDLHEGENIVGRERDAIVSIEAPSMSRHHARIIVSADGVSIEDLGSKNGTWVKGRRIHAIDHLDDGDKVLFGTIAATLRAVQPAASTETAR